MAWQGYIDTSLIGTGHIHKAAIISLAGDSVWATSPDFNITAGEMTILSAILSGDKKAEETAQTDGLYIAGQRYVWTESGEGTIYVRAPKNPEDANQEKTGVVVAKSLQAIVVGFHNHLQTRQNANIVVTGLVKYLTDLKY